jgi:Rod binding domain-containing protein
MPETVANPALASTAALESAATARPRTSEAKAREAAEAFESFFLAQVLQNLYAGMPTDGPFGGGTSEGVYRSMLNTQYAKAITEAGGVGIADAVYREILKLQEVTPS